MGRAVLHAARDPVTWIPAGAALAVTAADWDVDLSDRAIENRSIFGSERRALDWSDDLRKALLAELVASAFLVPPDGSRPRTWIRTIGLEQGGVLLTAAATETLKGTVARERPDRSDDRSFPSGHTSVAFACRAGIARNLAASRLAPSARIVLGAAVTLESAAVAWARVEGGVHYPADVLAGAALGNFLARTVTEAFLTSDSAVSLEARPIGGGPGLALAARF